MAEHFSIGDLTTIVDALRAHEQAAKEWLQYEKAEEIHRTLVRVIGRRDTEVRRLQTRIARKRGVTHDSQS